MGAAIQIVFENSGNFMEMFCHRFQEIGKQHRPLFLSGKTKTRFVVPIPPHRSTAATTTAITSQLWQFRICCQSSKHS